MSERGQIEAIWIKRMKFAPMDATPTATLVTNRGIVGNANQGGKRQVTIIEAEKWQAVMAQLGSNLDPAARRANLMVKGIRLTNQLNRILSLGNCRIRIWGETRPCERMDMALVGLKDALATDWGGGAYGEVLDDGTINVGDAVGWLD